MLGRGSPGRAVAVQVIHSWLNNQLKGKKINKLHHKNKTGSPEIIQVLPISHSKLAPASGCKKCML